MLPGARESSNDVGFMLGFDGPHLIVDSPITADIASEHRGAKHTAETALVDSCIPFVVDPGDNFGRYHVCNAAHERMWPKFCEALVPENFNSFSSRGFAFGLFLG